MWLDKPEPSTEIDGDDPTPRLALPSQRGQPQSGGRLRSKTGNGADAAEASGDPSAGQLAVESVTDAVYRRLRGQILGGLAPGQPLRLNDLAADLGVSTTPVRVALERLAADGLATRSGRRGAVVAPLSLTDFYDIYAIRRGLEGTAARIGAPNLSLQAVAVMQHDIRTLDRLAGARRVNVDAYLATEWHMRMTCLTAANHPRLLREIQTYRRQAERYLRLALSEGDNILADLEYQHLFCTTCASGDPDASEAVAQSLLEWTVERVAPIIEAADHA